MVLWSPFRCALTTPEVSTTNAETCDPFASQASIAVIAASTASASGNAYPDCATCAAAGGGRAIEAQPIKLSAAITDFIMLVSLADEIRLEIIRFQRREWRSTRTGRAA